MRLALTLLFRVHGIRRRPKLKLQIAVDELDTLRGAFANCTRKELFEQQNRCGDQIISFSKTKTWAHLSNRTNVPPFGSITRIFTRSRKQMLYGSISASKHAIQPLLLLFQYRPLHLHLGKVSGLHHPAQAPNHPHWGIITLWRHVCDKSGTITK